MPVIPALRTLKQDYFEFSLVYTAGPCLLKDKKSSTEATMWSNLAVVGS